jgi:hypothetical protein
VPTVRPRDLTLTVSYIPSADPSGVIARRLLPLLCLRFEGTDMDTIWARYRYEMELRVLLASCCWQGIEQQLQQFPQTAEVVQLRSPAPLQAPFSRPSLVVLAPPQKRNNWPKSTSAGAERASGIHSQHLLQFVIQQQEMGSV